MGIGSTLPPLPYGRSPRQHGMVHRHSPQTSALQQLLPRLDAALLVSKAPTLLSKRAQKALPEKMAQLQALLPGVDVER